MWHHDDDSECQACVSLDDIGKDLLKSLLWLPDLEEVIFIFNKDYRLVDDSLASIPLQALDHVSETPL